MLKMYNEFYTEIKFETFIGQWFIDDSICDSLIEFFNEDNQFPIRQGVTDTGIDLDIKHSFDKVISPITNDVRILNYLKSLEQVLDFYKQKYNFCDSLTKPWALKEPFNIQWYPPNGGFKKFHTERSGPSSPFAQRHLVFMTYLNDVTDDGETEFYYQKLKVQPQKGLTLIWPVDWTHTHRGIPSPTQEKMIITGWYSFY